MRKKRFESLESQRVPRLEGGAPPPTFLGRAFGFRRRLEIEGEGKLPPPIPSKPRPRSGVILEDPAGPSQRTLQLRREEARRKLAEIREQQQLERKVELAELENTRRYLKLRLVGLVFAVGILGFLAVRIWSSSNRPFYSILIPVLLSIYFAMARSFRDGSGP